MFDCTVPNNTLSRAELSYDEGTVLNVHYGDVLIKYGSVLDVQKDDIPRIPHRCREDFNGALLQDGDVIIADTAEDETTGKACEIGNLQGSAIVSGLHTMVCRPRNRMALGYLGYYLNSNAYHDQLLPLMQGIKVLSLSRSNIQKTSVSYPIAVKEQQLIAYYFSQLDNLITLHQRQPFLQSPPDISLIVQLTPPFYTFSWEQRKLGDMMNVTSVKRIHQSDWTDSGVRFLRARDIVAAAKNEEPDDYLYISKEKYEEYSTLSGKVGVSDLLVTGVGTIGVPYLVRNLEPLYFKDGNIIWFQNSDKIDGKFLFYSFSAEQIQGFINESAGIGTVGTYTIESGKKTPISLPNQIEQAKVGEFFQQLDNLITLHQRKFEKLTNVKKSMLEKMFPQNGSSYPEIRFKGFTDPWEQRKLSEITDKVTEKNAGLQYVETFTNSAEFGIISQRDFFDHDIAKLGSLDGYYIVKTEDFVYNPRISTSAPVGPINRNKLGRTGVMSPLYTVFRPHDIDTTYLEYFFKCGYWHSFMNFNGDSGARSDRFSIRDNVFFQMPIPIPDIDEQRKIGELLTCLDNLITLHQRKCIFFTGRAGRLISTVNKKRITSSWEQREVGDLLIERSQQAPMSDEYPLMAFIANEGVAPKGERYDRSALVTDTVNKLYKKTEKGDFIYSSNNLETGSIGLNKYGKACISPVYSIFEPTGIADSDFLGRRLVRKDFINAMVKWRQGVIYGQWRIHESDFLKIEISVPSVEEQRKIGAYLDQLDNLITLHQRELEKLQNIKKSMLEKMFV